MAKENYNDGWNTKKDLMTIAAYGAILFATLGGIRYFSVIEKRIESKNQKIEQLDSLDKNSKENPFKNWAYDL